MDKEIAEEIIRENRYPSGYDIQDYLFSVFLSLFALAACDEDNEEIVPMSYTDPVATVTKIDPALAAGRGASGLFFSDNGIINGGHSVNIGCRSLSEGNRHGILLCLN